MKIVTCVVLVFVGLILGKLPVVLEQAERSDRLMKGTLPVEGDSPEYQVLGVNLLYGRGFAYSVTLPPETYHLDLTTQWGRDLKEQSEKGALPQPAVYTFYRAPGLPLLLSVTYGVFGNNTLNARRMFAVQAVVTALLLLATGTLLAGAPGALAGGLTGLYYLSDEPRLYQFVDFLTEAPTAFWVALFCCLFVLYLKQRRFLWLVLAALALAGGTLTRSNLLPIAPFVAIYLWRSGHSLRRIALLVSIVFVPVITWSAYASLTMGKLVVFSTQGENAFPQYNNLDIVYGNEFGRPGDWLAGRGRLVIGAGGATYSNAPQPGENGWAKGLTFWRDNVLLLPRLFYVKLEGGFWYNYGDFASPVQPERLHLLGIGFLLAGIGLRSPRSRGVFSGRFNSRQRLLVQLGLLAALFVASNQTGLLIVLIIWSFILALAVFFPYSDALQLGFAPPTWYLAFVISHGITTLFFMGVRFHWPLDAPLMLVGLLGIFLVVQSIARLVFGWIRARPSLDSKRIAIGGGYLGAGFVAPIAIAFSIFQAGLLLNSPVANWLREHVADHTRLVAEQPGADIRQYTEAWPASKTWDWRTTLDATQKTVSEWLGKEAAQYLVLDEWAPSKVPFDQRLKMLIAQGATLLYVSDGLPPLRPRQAVLWTFRPEVSLDLTFNDSIELLGYHILRGENGDVGLLVHWYTIKPTSFDYNLFIHVIDPETGQLVGQADGPLGQGTHPTSTWRQNELVFEEFRIPAGLVEKSRHLRIGLYQLTNGQRAPIRNGQNLLATDFMDVVLP